MTDRFPRTVHEADHDLFRATVAAFIAAEVAPHHERWEAAEVVDRSLFTRAGEQGLLMPGTSERFGGAGIDDWRFAAVLDEEFGRSGYAAAGLGLALQNDVVGPYLLDLTDEAQKRRWLPGLTAGELIGAITMTEPGTGSDLAGISTRAVRDGDDYLVTGSKTFISNGQNADLVVVATRTSPSGTAGSPCSCSSAGCPASSAAATWTSSASTASTPASCTCTDVRAPVANRLGEEGAGCLQLVRNLPQERLSSAVTAVAACEGVLARTLAHVADRKAFWTSIGSFQHSRFLLAELVTEVDVARVFVDRCIELHAAGRLTATQAAEATWWTTELQVRVADRCLQLHGGYGCMREHAVGRAFVDARIKIIYGGTTEI